MRSTNEHGFSILAWAVSLALHGGLVWFAVLFTAQVKPVLNEEIFKWDVALVEPGNTDSTSEPVPQPAQESVEHVVPTVQPPPRVAARRPVESASDTVMHTVAPRQTVQMVHPEVEPPRPVEQREDPLPTVKPEPVTPPVKSVQEKTAEAVERQVVEAPKQQSEPVTPAKEPEPVQSAEPMFAQRPSGAVNAPPLENAKPVDPAPAVSSSPSPVPAEAPVQTAKVAPAPDVVDHRWLAESLWKRVAELKRYPSSARLNGQEGKVILKAVIRADGQLTEVSVQKSSGHTILDAAAIETVKLACPLHMKHPINKSEIVVSLPIVYSLAN
ncbi:MAG TPA: TonB family protein [Nitrospira sp.]|nr:TonB family protein [Nitrospira sp.]